jgi:hypothetical protein
MASSATLKGALAGNSPLAHKSAVDAGKMSVPLPGSEKMEYETAENAFHSDVPAAVETGVTNDHKITCDEPFASESAPESDEIPRNILGGTSISPVSLPQSFGGSAASGKMVDRTIAEGGLAGGSALPHKPREDTGKMPLPPDDYDEQAACAAISAALERRQRQPRLAKARRK